MTDLRFLRPALALAAVLAPTAALAHSGAGTAHGLAAGLAHPLLGLDHGAAMVAIGVIAARSGGTSLLALPTAFLAAMIAGAGLGSAGIGLPALETGVALSLVALGLAVALARPLPLAGAVLAAAVFGLFHGHAHGTEVPGTTPALAYGLGFVIATATLHAAGALAGLKLAGRRAVLRGVGAAAAFGGLALLSAG